jgi:hypothetical protein
VVAVRWDRPPERAVYQGITTTIERAALAQLNDASWGLSSNVGVIPEIFRSGDAAKDHDAFPVQEGGRRSGQLMPDGMAFEMALGDTKAFAQARQRKHGEEAFCDRSSGPGSAAFGGLASMNDAVEHLSDPDSS